MCGIFGYVGKKNAKNVILEGLTRLEYRGYDSWGVAVLKDNKIEVIKKIGTIGKPKDIATLPEASIGIGHTRWATHGGVTETNAHPHLSTDGNFILAQNGIVENYQELKKTLTEKGYPFYSQTDTEVIVRLIEEKHKTQSDLKEAVRMAFLDLKGRNTIILIDKVNNRIISVRNGSPLVLGLGTNEYYIASDTLSFSDKTDLIVYLNNYEIVECDNAGLKISDVRSGKEITYKPIKVNHGDTEINKEGFDHFMLKEIVDQKHTIRDAVQYTLEDLKPFIDAIKKARHVYTVGAGTAGFAAGQIAFFLRKYAQVNAIELRSYEVGSYSEIFGDKDLLIAVSQSGETADTIEAIEIAREKGVKIASIVNMIGSTTSRISDFQFFSRSGPEICVASTKAFTAQSAWGLLIALSIAGKYSEAIDIIYNVSDKLENYFTNELYSQIKKFVKSLVKKEHFFILGRDHNYYTALEGALKVKEITYKHFEGFASGELKHGVIALVEKGTPVFIIVSNDKYKDDMLSAAAEVRARGAFVVGIGKENNELFDEFIATPDGGLADPIASIIPFQLISYFLGVELGNSPDKPRNLAKSVTVK